MAQKQFFFLHDTETTEDGTVADFGGIIVDRKGKIYNQISILVDGHFGSKKLFHDKNSSEAVWTLAGLKKRNENYLAMLNSGLRTIGSVGAINRWLQKAHIAYPNLIATAYNLEFDLRACQKTGIFMDGFSDTFCLWRASVDKLSKDKRYLQHCLNRKWVTPKLNFRTNAEAVAEYAAKKELPPEPHTALEDVIDYELHILLWLVKNTSYKKYSQLGYNWQAWQVKNLVIPK